VGEAVFSLYPFPNNPSGPYGANSYTTELPQDSNGRLYSLKLDKPFHTGSIEHRVTARFNRSLESSVVPVTRNALYSSVRPYFGTTNVAGYFTTNFSARLLNSFRASYGTTSGHFLDRRDPRLLGSTLLPDVSFLLNADVVGTNQKTEDLLGFLGSVNVAGFSPLGVDVARFPQKRQDETYQFGDLLTFSSGAHVISAGVDVRDIRLNSASEPNARPAIEFHGLRTPDLAGFVPVAPRVFSAASLAAAGIPAGVYHTLAFNGAVTGNPIAYTPLSLAQRHWDAYVQEQWRATSRLTLTAGIRAGRNGLPRDADNRILRGFDARQLADLAAKAINDPNPPVSCRNLPPPGCGDVPAIFARQFPPDFPDAFGQRSTVADPRIGFALTLNNGATVVRGGWGKQTAQFPAILITESQSAFPDYLPLNIAGYDPLVLTSFGNRAYNEGFRLAYPRTSSGVVAPGTANVIDHSGIALDPINLLVFKLQAPALDSVQPSFRLKSAYSLQQAFSLDHQFAESISASLSYVGAFGRNLLRATTPDGGFARAAVIPSGVPDRNGSPGFYPQLAPAQPRASDLFSLAKLVYEGSGTSSYHSLQATMRVQTRKGTTVFTALTYSHAIDNVTDLFDTAGAPALPQDSARRSERGSASFDQRLRVATHLVWQAPEQAWVFKRLELALIHIHSTGQPYTVNSAIDNNRDGNLTDRPPNASGRNMFRGPSSDALDFSLGRTFRFRDGRHLLQPRIEVFNALNRAELALPVRVAESPGFGSSVRTIAPARIVQAGLRYSF